MSEPGRREILRALGATGLVGVAGCTGGGNGDGDGGGGDEATPLSGEEYPAVDRWLTETEIGGAAEGYDGTIPTRPDVERLEVAVGAEGNGGYFAFDPVAVAVSTGTTVEFAWTGRGGAHNVEALPEEQLGESDYEFSSGEAVDEEGKTYTRTMDRSGIVLYHCEPHLSLGMKGAIVVR